jgi:hypothetical protein
LAFVVREVAVHLDARHATGVLGAGCVQARPVVGVGVSAGDRARGGEVVEADDLLPLGTRHGDLRLARTVAPVGLVGRGRRRGGERTPEGERERGGQGEGAAA